MQVLNLILGWGRKTGWLDFKNVQLTWFKVRQLNEFTKREGEKRPRTAI